VCCLFPATCTITLRICAQRGAGPGCNTQEVGEKLTDLKEEISKLEDHEQLLDTHTRWIQQSIKNIENDIINKKYAYITYEDVKENFVDGFVLGIEAPPKTELIVPNVLKVFKKIIRKFVLLHHGCRSNLPNCNFEGRNCLCTLKDLAYFFHLFIFIIWKFQSSKRWRATNLRIKSCLFDFFITLSYPIFKKLQIILIHVLPYVYFFIHLADCHTRWCSYKL